MSRLKILTEQHIFESFAIKEKVAGACCTVLPEMARAVAETFFRKGRLFIFGNGGSAADAQHIAAEFVNRLKRERNALPAMALTVDTSILTSISNDYRFEDIFVRQVSAFGNPGDMALGISTSGRSPNVLKALRWANENGLGTLGFAGLPGSDMNECCNSILNIPSTSTMIIQECHIMAGHILCALTEEVLLGPVDEIDGHVEIPAAAARP